MSLQSVMEKKQLDFNQPFLTVRRFSPSPPAPEAKNNKETANDLPRMPPIPVYRSELKSGPVRNPGTVPFVWEKTPGRPKDEGRPQAQAVKGAPMAPKLPPGRILDTRLIALDKGSEGKSVGHSQTRNGLPCSENFPSLDKNVTKEESSKEGMEETGSGSDSADEAYVDALDTLSRSESFFLNCSISGVSGLDGPDVKPSVPFSTDPAARDFMMGRFLPAAKAMASETPQFSARKPPVAREQPRQIKKVVTVQKHRPVNQQRPTNIPHYAQSSGAEESEDDEDDYEVPDSSLKVCGLFPRLCLQSSVFLMNPVTGIRKPAQASISSVRTRQVKSSYAASCGEAEHEYRGAECERESMVGPKKIGVHGSKDELKSESNQVPENKYKALDESPHYKLLQGNGTLRVVNGCSKPGMLREKDYVKIHEKTIYSGFTGFSSPEKCNSSFGELLAKESCEWESASTSPVVEKTLYVGSVNMVKPQISNSSSSELEGLSDYSAGDTEILVKTWETKDTAPLNSFPQDIKYLDVKEKVHLDSMESVDSFLSMSDRSFHNVQEGVADTSEQDQEPTQERVALTKAKKEEFGRVDLESQSENAESYKGIQCSLVVTSEKVADCRKIVLETEVSSNLSDRQTSGDSYVLLPPPPPLPKSPSESWLQRTLPTFSFRNSSSRSSLGMRAYPGAHTSETHSQDSKWETIVRTTNVQHGRLRFSEELLTPIPET